VLLERVLGRRRATTRHKRQAERSRARLNRKARRDRRRASRRWTSRAARWVRRRRRRPTAKQVHEQEHRVREVHGAARIGVRGPQAGRPRPPRKRWSRMSTASASPTEPSPSASPRRKSARPRHHGAPVLVAVGVVVVLAPIVPPRERFAERDHVLHLLAAVSPGGRRRTRSRPPRLRTPGPRVSTSKRRSLSSLSGGKESRRREGEDHWPRPRPRWPSPPSYIRELVPVGEAEPPGASSAAVPAVDRSTMRLVRPTRSPDRPGRARPPCSRSRPGDGAEHRRGGEPDRRSPGLASTAERALDPQVEVGKRALRPDLERDGPAHGHRTRLPRMSWRFSHAGSR
jgi:hypothetical protein